MEVGPERAPSNLQRVFDVSLLFRRQLTPLKAELILNTQIIVADIHQEMSGAGEGADGWDKAVSGTSTSYHIPTQTDRRLDSKQVRNLNTQRI